MREYDATLRNCSLQDGNVRSPRQALVAYGYDIVPFIAKDLNHRVVYVFVGKQWELERLHAGIVTSHTTSFVIDLAAY